MYIFQSYMTGSGVASMLSLTLYITQHYHNCAYHLPTAWACERICENCARWHTAMAVQTRPQCSQQICAPPIQRPHHKCMSLLNRHLPRFHQAVAVDAVLFCRSSLGQAGSPDIGPLGSHFE